MDESEVVKAVRNWIRSEHPNWVIRRAWHFDVVAGPSKNQPSIAVECKGHPSLRFKVHRAIGQCLNYTTESELRNVPCFIAIPKHFIFNNVMLKTLENHNLPIGLLTVTDNGEITILRRVKGSHIGE